MTEKYLALRELRFVLKNGERLIVAQGQAVPSAAWESLTPAQTQRLVDPYQRKVARVTMP